MSTNFNASIVVTELLMKTLECCVKDLACRCISEVATRHGFNAEEEIRSLGLDNLSLIRKQMAKKSQAPKKEKQTRLSAEENALLVQQKKELREAKKVALREAKKAANNGSKGRPKKTRISIHADNVIDLFAKLTECDEEEQPEEEQPVGEQPVGEQAEKKKKKLGLSVGEKETLVQQKKEALEQERAAKKEALEQERAAKKVEREAKQEEEKKQRDAKRKENIEENKLLAQQNKTSDKGQNKNSNSTNAVVNAAPNAVVNAAPNAVVNAAPNAVVNAVVNAAPNAVVNAAPNAVVNAAPKISVTRKIIDGIEYFKTSSNILYDAISKDEIGIWDVETNTIKPLPEDEEEEEEEEGYESD